MHVPPTDGECVCEGVADSEAERVGLAVLEGEMEADGLPEKEREWLAEADSVSVATVLCEWLM